MTVSAAEIPTKQNHFLIQPTEADGEWIGEALAGVLPEEFDSRVWLQEQPTEYEGRLVNRFRQLGQNLVVLVAVSPINVQGSDEKKAGYHVIIFKEDQKKIKRPNEADISRARKTFFRRDPTGTELVHQGPLGDSKAYHVMSVFPWKPIILTGA